MARVRQLVRDEATGRMVTGYTKRKGGRPPARALWEITISAGKDADGRWRQRSERLTGTWTQANDRATAMEAAAGAGQRTANDRHTLAETMTAYIEHRRLTGRAAKTIVGYESLAKTIGQRIGKVELHRLGADDLDAYYRWLLTVRELSPSTAHHHHAFLSQVLNQAIKWRWLAPPNPAGSATPPPLERPEPESPTPAEIQVLVEAVRATNPGMATLLLLAAITGCRRGEVCAWRWSYFDDATGQLTVRKSLTLGGVEKETKTKKTRRMAIDARAALVLADQWDRYVAECRAVEIDPDRDSFVFSSDSDHGTPWKPDTVTQAFRRLREREVKKLRKAAEEARTAGDEKAARAADASAVRMGRVRLSHFRHFAATQMAGAGVDVKTASARMGHDGAVFFRHYAGVIDAKDQEAAELLSSLLLPELAVVNPT